MSEKSFSGSFLALLGTHKQHLLFTSIFNLMFRLSSLYYDSGSFAYFFDTIYVASFLQELFVGDGLGCS